MRSTYLGPILTVVLLLALFVTLPAAEGQKTTKAVQAPWSPEKAWTWYKSVRPIRGCNYLPRTAVNDTEMWQSETFDPKTIDQELGWAEEVGYNSLRVFLQYIVWEHDPDGLKKRMGEFLALANKHGLTVTFVLFDDCAFAGREPYLGKQENPIPGVHNSGWVPSPGPQRVTEKRYWPRLKAYVTDLVGSYRSDPRVLAWDLYNEPGNENTGNKSLPLLQSAFVWARQAAPTQPLTAGFWSPKLKELNETMFGESDIITFHAYSDAQSMESTIKELSRHGRPLICTECLRRQVGCTFAAVLPIFAKYEVQCWLVQLGSGGRKDTDLHVVGLQEGRPHAESMATRYVPSGRDAVRSSGNQIDTKLAATSGGCPLGPPPMEKASIPNEQDATAVTRSSS